MKHHMEMIAGARGLAAASMLALCCSLGGCGKGQAPDAAAVGPTAPDAMVREAGRIKLPEASPLRKSLQLATVQEQSLEAAISVPAVLEADPAKLVRVLPPVAGRITRIHKRLGDTVARGDALFALDSADLAQAIGDAIKARTVIRQANRNYQRQRELSELGIAARKDLEQAESDQAQASADADRSQARLAQLGLAPDAVNTREFVLRSPIAGRVIDLPGAQGGYWNDTNAPIMTVADLSSVWLAASVPEKDLASVFVGQAARITLNAYDGEALQGKVAYVGPVVDADTRTVKVRIAVDNTSGRFRPGMFARASLRAAAHKALVVPATALVQNGFNTRVYVALAPGVFEPRVVVTGAQANGLVEITSGLKAGEQIVVKDGVLLND